MKKILNLSLKPTISYSQNREDIILASFFTDVKNGFYVDIGASHPDYLSVTKHFYSRGWSGVNIEPNKRLYKLLQRSRPRDTTYDVAISDKTTKVAMFREYLGDGLSTIVDPTQDKELQKSILTDYFTDYEVRVRSLQSILEEIKPKVVHFLKIDVEGHEPEVVKSHDWAKYRPRIVCINVAHGNMDASQFLEKKRYRRLFHDGINDYFYDESFYDLSAPAIDYNFMYGPDVITPLWATVVNEQRQQIEILNGDILRFQKELKVAITDPTKLRFRTIGKVTLKKVDKYITGKLTPSHRSRHSTSQSVPLSDSVKKVNLTVYSSAKNAAKKIVKRAKR